MATIKSIILVAFGFLAFAITSCQKDDSLPFNPQEKYHSLASENNPKLIKGKIKSKQTSAAVAGASISIYRSSTSTLVGTVYSNIDGEYQLDSVFPGDHNIQVSADGYEPLEIQNYPIDTTAIQQLPDIEVSEE